MIVNNSDDRLKWTFDVRNPDPVLDAGVFRFLHSSGMPYLTFGQGGVEGELEPGQTQTVQVIFCPGMSCNNYHLYHIVMVLMNQ